VLFYDNSNSHTGGGMYIGQNSSVWIHHSEFIGNTAAYGGGLYSDHADALVENCIFTANYTSQYGGGVSIRFGTVVMTNFVVHDNSSKYNAAGMWILYGEPYLTNAIITDNWDATTGNGAYYDSTIAHLSYNNFYGNDSPEFTYAGSTVYGESTNLASDPLFTDVSDPDPLNWDFTLQATSPLIDAGDPTLFDDEAGTDRSDVGAYGGVGALDW
jgi:hypothetical protein